MVSNDLRLPRFATVYHAEIWESSLDMSPAQAVYSNTDILSVILSQAEECDLPKMMCMEKAITALAARAMFRSRVIYKERADQMVAGTIAHGIYCDAVCLLDVSISPPPHFDQLQSRVDRANSPTPLPLHFNLRDQSLMDSMMKFPHLSKISLSVSTSSRDDLWVCHVYGGVIVRIEVESCVELDLGVFPFNRPVVPPPPTFAGVEVKQTFRILIVEGGMKDWGVDDSGREAHHAVVREFLYGEGEESMDRRCVGVEAAGWYGPDVARLYVQDAIKFFTRRNIEGCEPWRTLEISGDFDMRDELHLLLKLVGPGLRSLSMDDVMVGSSGGLRRVMGSLNSACPNLRVLRLIYYSGFKPVKLEGLKQLSVLALTDRNGRPTPVESLADLGSKECIFQLGTMNRHDKAIDFQHSVVELKEKLLSDRINSRRRDEEKMNERVVIKVKTKPRIKPKVTPRKPIVKKQK